ncbi:hypothetical protein CH362_13515 [Leptospira saintgironsiae]|uniref:Uncharacterized protein n=1 Tax=Leptospira saintgironsiae TaxID=2023183 RepID=A0A2M9YB27_9LEPT|nr:hypothetical protein CH362_13515 [Leptospira saintgironsiae]
MQNKISLPIILNEVNLLFSKNCNIEIENYQIEKESSDYNATFFENNKMNMDDSERLRNSLF